MSTEVTQAPDNNSIFQTLESYPWDRDGEYQIGLSAILGSATDASQIQELTLHAQVFYLSRKKNIPIDFDAYKAYLSSKSTNISIATSNLNSGSTPDSTFIPSTTDTSTDAPTPPPHRLRAPSGSLPSTLNPISATEDTNSLPDSQTPATSSKPSEAPYPPTFAEIVALITSGAPIPGIVDIPSTLLPEKATKPIAQKRRKPWETDVPDEVVQGMSEGTFGDRRDEVIVQELPE